MDNKIATIITDLVKEGHIDSALKLAEKGINTSAQEITAAPNGMNFEKTLNNFLFQSLPVIKNIARKYERGDDLEQEDGGLDFSPNTGAIEFRGYGKENFLTLGILFKSVSYSIRQIDESVVIRIEGESQNDYGNLESIYKDYTFKKSPSRFTANDLAKAFADFLARH